MECRQITQLMHEIKSHLGIFDLSRNEKKIKECYDAKSQIESSLSEFEFLKWQKLESWIYEEIDPNLLDNFMSARGEFFWPVKISDDGRWLVRLDSSSSLQVVNCVTRKEFKLSLPKDHFTGTAIGQVDNCLDIAHDLLYVKTIFSANGDMVMFNLNNPEGEPIQMPTDAKVNQFVALEPDKIISGFSNSDIGFADWFGQINEHFDKPLAYPLSWSTATIKSIQLSKDKKFAGTIDENNGMTIYRLSDKKPLALEDQIKPNQISFITGSTKVLARVHKKQDWIPSDDNQALILDPEVCKLVVWDFQTNVKKQLKIGFSDNHVVAASDPTGKLIFITEGKTGKIEIFDAYNLSKLSEIDLMQIDRNIFGYDPAKMEVTDDKIVISMTSGDIFVLKRKYQEKMVK